MNIRRRTLRWAVGLLALDSSARALPSPQILDAASPNAREINTLFWWIAGLVMLGDAFGRTLRGAFRRPEGRAGSDVPVVYWHMVDAVWLDVLVIIYLLPYVYQGPSQALPDSTTPAVPPPTETAPGRPPATAPGPDMNQGSGPE